MDVNWETCKENVQPLKLGRNVQQLDEMLAAAKGSETYEQRRQKRNEFEGMLRSDPEEPIEIWYDYITWIEKSYPEGGEEANLNKVLESCISELYNEERYKNDERFLEIFLKYMKVMNDHLEMFQILFNSDTFVELASFYCHWSSRLQEVSDYKKAEEVLKKGITRMAHPTKLLHSSLDRLKQLIEMESENQPEQSDDENDDGRKALISLKCTKKKSGKLTAPIERTKNYQDEKYRLGNQASSSQTPNVQVKVYNDENAASCLAENDPVAPIASREVVNRIVINNQENDRKAGKWCDQKLKIKAPPVIVEAPAFSIFEDPDLKSSGEAEELNKYKGPVMDNALRTLKKHEKSPKLCLFEKLAPNQRFHANLKKIYVGSTEFSFEEIRFRKILAVKKRQEEKQMQEKLKQELDDIKNTLAGTDSNIQMPKSQNLQDDVAFLKQQLSALLQQKASQENAPCFALSKSKDRTTCKLVESKCTTGAIVSDENEIPKLESPLVKSAPKKEDLTIVQNLFNGTLEGEDEEEDDDEDDGDLMTMKTAGAIAAAKKDFSIYKDSTVMPEPVKREMTAIGRPSLIPDTTISSGFKNFTDAHTIALPNNENDFIAMCSSTPAPYRAERMQPQRSEDLDNYSINPFSGAPTGKLSPIVETSKEYKSSSSSSSSGYNSTYRYRTFRK